MLSLRETFRRREMKDFRDLRGVQFVLQISAGCSMCCNGEDKSVASGRKFTYLVLRSSENFNCCVRVCPRGADKVDIDPAQCRGNLLLGSRF